MDFRKRIIKDYSIIFDGNNTEDTEPVEAETFASKWGYFGMMYQLCNGDISKLEKITKLNVMEAFTWLCYETDLNSLKKVNLNGK